MRSFKPSVVSYRMGLRNIGCWLESSTNRVKTVSERLSRLRRNPGHLAGQPVGGGRLANRRSLAINYCFLPHGRHWCRWPLLVIGISFIILHETHHKFPFLSCHFRNTQAALAERLHLLQYTTVLRVSLQLFELDQVRKFTPKRNMHFAPPWVFYGGFGIIVRVGRIER